MATLHSYHYDTVVISIRIELIAVSQSILYLFSQPIVCFLYLCECALLLVT